MYGHQHPLSQKIPSGKIILGLTFPQLIVLLIGARLSYDLSRVVPALPLQNFVFAHIHHMIPFFAAFFFLIAKNGKTGLPIATYFFYWLRFKFRKRVYIWKRGHS